MNSRSMRYLAVLISVAVNAGAQRAAAQTVISGAEAAQAVELPPPFATPSVDMPPKVVGWPEGKTPTVPAGFRINPFARLDSPRWIYVLPSGDLLVSQSSTNRRRSPNTITLLSDSDGNGEADKQVVVADDLHQPFGMALVGDTLYIGVTDAVLAVPFRELMRMEGEAKKIADLPAGGYNNHWTRNILPSPDGKKLYVSVGSGSNVAEHGIEHEKNRACILEMNPDGSEMRVFGSGLRNPVGMAWEPESGMLWTAVNERDGLGDDLVPDYITSVRDGGFYGWPYSYFGQHEDPRLKGQRPDLVAKAIVPDVPLGSHTASLGLVFYGGELFPQKYRGGAFVGQHGSWNRSQLAGYRVVYVPFAGGKAAGEREDFVTGFVSNAGKREVHGRPVGVAVAVDGALLVADDGGNVIWRVVPDGGNE